MHLPVTEVTTKEKVSFIDKVLPPIITFAGPILTLPQVYKIWVTHTAAGVSIISWTAYSVLGFLWMLYAFRKHDKAVLVNNFLYFILGAVIVAGTILYSR